MSYIIVIAYRVVALEGVLNYDYFPLFSGFSSSSRASFLPSSDYANIHDVLHSFTPGYSSVAVEVYKSH